MEGKGKAVESFHSEVVEITQLEWSMVVLAVC